LLYVTSARVKAEVADDPCKSPMMEMTMGAFTIKGQPVRAASLEALARIVVRGDTHAIGWMAWDQTGQPWIHVAPSAPSWFVAWADRSAERAVPNIYYRVLLTDYVHFPSNAELLACSAAQ
jgi:hypothetical protein